MESNNTEDNKTILKNNYNNIQKSQTMTILASDRRLAAADIWGQNREMWQLLQSKIMEV